MSWSLHMVIPFLPPSSNKIYIQRRQGGKALSKDSRYFLEKFKTEVVPKYLPRMQVIPENETIFEVEFLFFFETLINKGFAVGKAKTRYKRIDVSNRVKLLEDALKDVLAVDDSLFFRSTNEKLMSPGNARVEIVIRAIDDPREFGIPEVDSGQETR